MKHIFVSIVFALSAMTVRAATTAELKQFAAAGDTGAMVILGTRYLYGIGGERQDYTEAEKWCRMAAVRRDFDGAYGIGTASVNQRHYVDAYSWFSLYADEDEGLRQARDDVMSLLKGRDRAAAIESAKKLKDIIIREQGALLLQAVQKAKNGK